jgi:hypothetical protein
MQDYSHVYMSLRNNFHAEHNFIWDVWFSCSFQVLVLLCQNCTWYWTDTSACSWSGFTWTLLKAQTFQWRIWMSIDTFKQFGWLHICFVSSGWLFFPVFFEEYFPCCEHNSLCHSFFFLHQINGSSTEINLTVSLKHIRDVLEAFKSSYKLEDYITWMRNLWMLITTM